MEGYNTAKEAFLAREETLRQTSAHMEKLWERDKQLENAFVRVHAFQLLDQELAPLNEADHQETEMPQVLMNDDQFETAINFMNDGQIKAFKFVTKSILEQIDSSEKRLRLFLTGNAGTGKTFLFKLLHNQVNRCYGHNAAKVCALTGVAARLVGGSTIHSMLKLPVQKNGRLIQLPMLTGNYLRIMRRQWKDVEFLFIDEILMVPYEMLCMIDSRLKQLKNSESFFGGINVLLFGDLMQLAPVRGHQVFHQPLAYVPATHIWRLFMLVELTENMRQQGSTLFVDILNALRIGELRAKHMDVLLDKVSTNETGEFAIDKALRIFPTNEQVHEHNLRVLQYFEERGMVMTIIKAQDQIVDATRNINNIDLDKIIPNDINKTGGMPKELIISVGAKIMLRSNIDVAKGLVNGTIGTIIEIIWPNFRRAQMYSTDIPSVRVDFGKDGIHIINPRSIQFQANYSYGTAERRMLPFVLCWASTVHKMQGSTVDNASIYLGSKLFKEGQAYVAISRVRSLEGLQITELDPSKLTSKTPCNTDALAETDRMRNYQIYN